jgi:hypothetical protein
MDGCRVYQEAPPLGPALGEPELHLANGLRGICGRLVEHPLLQLLNPALREKKNTYPGFDRWDNRNLVKKSTRMKILRFTPALRGKRPHFQDNDSLVKRPSRGLKFPTDDKVNG